jgi:hypothetical protein
MEWNSWIGRTHPITNALATTVTWSRGMRCAAQIAPVCTTAPGCYTPQQKTTCSVTVFR